MEIPKPKYQIGDVVVFRGVHYIPGVKLISGVISESFYYHNEWRYCIITKTHDKTNNIYMRTDDDILYKL